MKTLSAIVVNRNGASVLVGNRIPDVFQHYGGKSILEGCLAALAPLAEAGDAEILVVDNGSTDGSADLVRARFPACRLLANRENRGFAPAVVQAAALSDARFLLLVNSDVLIDPPKVRKLLEVMEGRPGLGVLTCLTRYPGGLLQRPASRFQTPGGVLAQMAGLKTPHDGDFDATRYGEPDWVAGGVMLIRREAWDAVGGMDPGFVFYEEDADFCLRLRKAGWGVGYTPEVEVMHVRAATASLDPVFSLTQRYRSLLRYCGKHFPPGACLLIRGAVALRMLPRALTALLKGEGPGMAGAAMRVAGEAMASGRCRCGVRADAEEALPTRERFVKGMTVLESDSGLWSELLVCDTCGARWRVEVHAEIDRRHNHAFKVPPQADWRTLDLIPGLRAIEIRKAGGLSSDPCSWAGCTNPSLKGKRICADHALTRS